MCHLDIYHIKALQNPNEHGENFGEKNCFHPFSNIFLKILVPIVIETRLGRPRLVIEISAGCPRLVIEIGSGRP